jgi:hypothetical protein
VQVNEEGDESSVEDLCFMFVGKNVAANGQLRGLCSVFVRKRVAAQAQLRGMEVQRVTI